MSDPELDSVYLREQLDLAVGRFLERAETSRLLYREKKWALRWLHKVDNSIPAAEKERDEASGIPQVLADAAVALQKARKLEGFDRMSHLAHVLERIHDVRRLKDP